MVRRGYSNTVRDEGGQILGTYFHSMMFDVVCIVYCVVHPCGLIVHVRADVHGFVCLHLPHDIQPPCHMFSMSYVPHVICSPCHHLHHKCLEQTKPFSQHPFHNTSGFSAVGLVGLVSVVVKSKRSKHPRGRMWCCFCQCHCVTCMWDAPSRFVCVLC